MSEQTMIERRECLDTARAKVRKHWAALQEARSELLQAERDYFDAAHPAALSDHATTEGE